MQKMLNKIKAHYLSEANKDIERKLTHPTRWNVAASLLCVALLLAWGGWCGYLGWQYLDTGVGHFKTAEVTASGSPIRFGLATIGLFGLAAFSLDGALCYAVEAWMRIGRILKRGEPVTGSPNPSNSGPHAVEMGLSREREQEGVPAQGLREPCPGEQLEAIAADYQRLIDRAPNKPGERYFARRLFGLLCLGIGLWLGYRLIESELFSIPFILGSVCLLVGGVLLVAKPESLQA